MSRGQGGLKPLPIDGLNQSSHLRIGQNFLCNTVNHRLSVGWGRVSLSVEISDDVNWQDFEAILDELGARRAARVAYNQGILEIRMPLPEHEFNKKNYR